MRPQTSDRGSGSECGVISKLPPHLYSLPTGASAGSLHRLQTRSFYIEVWALSSISYSHLKTLSLVGNWGLFIRGKLLLLLLHFSVVKWTNDDVGKEGDDWSFRKVIANNMWNLIPEADHWSYCQSLPYFWKMLHRGRCTVTFCLLQLLLMAMLVVHGIINPDDFILMKFDTGPFIITTDTDAFIISHCWLGLSKSGPWLVELTRCRALIGWHCDEIHHPSQEEVWKLLITFIIRADTRYTSHKVLNWRLSVM